MKILCLSLVIAILSFLGGSNGIQITCDYESADYTTISNAFTDPIFYKCVVKAYDTSVGSPDKVDSVVDFDDPKDPAEEITFVHFVGEDCPSLGVTSVPQGLEEVFPNIRALWLALCSIDTLNVDDLSNYPNLEIVVIAGSSFSVIPEGFLDPVQNTLIYLSFYQNQINEVEVDLLAGLTNLERAYFGSNQCIDSSATEPAEIPELNEELNANCTPEPPCEISPNLEFFACELQSQIQALQEKDQELETAIEEINESLTNLETTITTVEEEIENLQTEAESLTESLSNVTTRVDDLETKTNDLENRTTTLEDKTEELESEDESLKEDLEETKSKLCDLQAENEELKAILEGYEARLFCLESRVKPKCGGGRIISSDSSTVVGSGLKILIT